MAVGERAAAARYLRGAFARPRPPGSGVLFQRRGIGPLRPPSIATHLVPRPQHHHRQRLPRPSRLAERENRIERFFINLVLVRVLYAHALVAAPRLALAWLAPIARWLGHPRLDMTGMFLSVSRVLPHLYPLRGELADYIADEHAFGRLLDLGVIVPRFTELYRWSARGAADPGGRRSRL